ALVSLPIGDGDLIGTLAEVGDNDPQAGQATATIRIVGHGQAAGADVAVNARVRFVFTVTPPQAEGAPASSNPEDGTIDAQGAIVRLTLAQVETGRGGGRKRELILERRLTDDSPLSL